MKRVALVAAVACVLVLIAIVLFPVFAKPPPGKAGLLLDGLGNPVAGHSVIAIRGGRSLTSVTDSQGRFDIPRNAGSDLPSVLGQVLTQVMKSTGGTTRYAFSEPASLSVRLQREDGKPLGGDVTVYLGTDTISAQGGTTLVAAEVPSGFQTRYAAFRPLDPSLRLVRVERTFQNGKVVLKAIFGPWRQPPAKRTWMSFDGKRVRFHGQR